MALQLPHNFKNDIQGKNTALVPLVRIGNFTGNWDDYIYISTGEHNIVNSDGDNLNILPILLNIPTLKETIEDILNNWEKYSPMIENAFNKAVSRYTTQKFVKKIVKQTL